LEDGGAKTLNISFGTYSIRQVFISLIFLKALPTLVIV